MNHLVLASLGLVGVRVGSRDRIAEPFQGIFSAAEVEYTIFNISDAGHEYSIVESQPEFWEELFHDARGLVHRCELPYGLAGHYAHLQALAELRAVGLDDRLSIEEITLTLLRRLTRVEAPRVREVASQRAMIDRVRQLIVAQLEQNVGLQVLAEEAGCSPFHLARLFRAHTGRSIRRFRLEARIAHALSLMAQGADNLSYIAVDCGFSTHSHMSEAFRTILGQSPSQSRRGLGDMTRRQTFATCG